MLHQRFHVDPIGARDNDDAAWVLVIGLIAQVSDHRQFLGLHLSGDLLQHLGSGNLMRERGDHDVAVLDTVNGPHAHGTSTCLIDLQQIRTRRDDLRLGREIRPKHMLAELLDAGARLVKQAYAGGRHFAQVVRRHVSGHAHGDTGGAVEQKVGQTRRQRRRFVERAIEIRHPIHRALSQLAEQHLGIARQTRLGVAHRGKGLRIVRGAPVALTVDQRIAIAEWLRHQHHGLVTGTVTMGMELTEHVTDGPGGLLVLGVGVQPELAHGVDDPPLHRLEAVADMRQRTIHDHVHGIVEVSLLGEIGEGATLHAIQAQVDGFAHQQFSSAMVG